MPLGVPERRGENDFERGSRDRRCQPADGRGAHAMAWSAHRARPARLPRAYRANLSRSRMTRHHRLLLAPPLLCWLWGCGGGGGAATNDLPPTVLGATLLQSGASPAGRGRPSAAAHVRGGDAGAERPPLLPTRTSRWATARSATSARHRPCSTPARCRSRSARAPRSCPARRRSRSRPPTTRCRTFGGAFAADGAARTMRTGDGSAPTVSLCAR